MREPEQRPLREVSGEPVIVVGDGPAGLFCAHELAREGIASIVLERGKTVQPRRHDLAALQKQGVVDPDAAPRFRARAAPAPPARRRALRAPTSGLSPTTCQELVDAGAPEDVLVDARPHIGSNRLPRVVTALRTQLEAVGVRFEMGARVVRLLVHDGAIRGQSRCATAG